MNWLDDAYPRALAVPEFLQTEFGRRAAGLTVALVFEVLVLLALLSLSRSVTTPEKPLITTVAAQNYTEPAPDEPEPEPQQQPHNDQPTPQPVQTAVAPPQPAPSPAIVIPTPEAPRVQPAPEAPTPPRPGVRMGPPQGPPNSPAPSTASSDSERVGTAQNGEPLYAARWYREPGDEVRGFFADSSPGSGLIACRTIPNYYVTDCYGIGETRGSNIIRAMLAASGNFRVRPAQIGGRSLVGSWVRIRFDYIVRRRPESGG